MSSRSLPAVALHVIAIAIMTWGYMGLERNVMHMTIIKQKGGHLQFLTIQALAVSWLTMILGLLYDTSQSRYLWRAKRALFMIALPLSFVVTTIHWSLITFFPRLILPPAPEPAITFFAQSPDGLARIPLSLDLALHAAPAITLLVDFFLFETSYGPKEARNGATSMAAVFGLWYAAWVEYCASFNGVFPYPFLTENPFPIRVVIYAVVTTMAFLSFRAINFVHLFVVGRPCVPSANERAKEVIEKTE